MNQSCSWDRCAGLFNSCSHKCCIKCTNWRRFGGGDKSCSMGFKKGATLKHVPFIEIINLSMHSLSRRYHPLKHWLENLAAALLLQKENNKPVAIYKTWERRRYFWYILPPRQVEL